MLRIVPKTILLLFFLAITMMQPNKSEYPCGVCYKDVSWNERGIACDECSIWFHASCVHMNTVVYDAQRTNISWYCCNCGLPKFSSDLFGSVPVETIHPSLLDISRTTLSTPSPHSTNSSTHSFNFHGLPPPSSTPIHCVNPPSFNSDQNSTVNSSSESDPSQTEKPLKLDNILRTMIVNFQGIRGKKTRVWHTIESANPDIIIGTETFLKPWHGSAEYFPPNYNVFRCDRVSGEKGGALIATKTNLVAHEIPHKATLVDAEAVYVKIQIHNSTQALVVGSIYRTNQSNTKEQIDSITESMNILKQNDINWVGGDLNLPDIDWETQAITGHQYPIHTNQTFLDKMHDKGLSQTVREETRQKNILDLFCTNRPNLVVRTKIIPRLGDHDIVLTDSRLKAKKIKPVPHKISIWKKADFDAIKRDTEAFSKAFLENPPEIIEEQWKLIQDHLIEMMNKHVPTKTASIKFHQPWINNKIKRLARRKKRAWKKAKRTNEDKHWERFKNLRKETRRESRKAHSDYVKSFIEEETQKNLWKFIKSKKNDSSGVAPLTKDGVTYSEGKDKADRLNDQFCSVFTEEDLDNLPKMTDSIHPSMQKIKVTTEGVEKLLQNLNPRKASGPDGIPCRLLQSLAKELAPTLTHLFSSSLESGKIPKIWKHALVQPIFKKGDRSKAANYRPISLTCICCKLLEHIIRSAITSHLENNSILTDAQHGFRKKRSCESQLILTVNDLAEVIDKGGQTDTILLDFSKAFDVVPHQRLIMKLHHYGIRNNTLAWIQNFLYERTQEVVVEGQKSSIGKVTSGVPQGSVLGPTLFLMYINDLGEDIDAKVRLFADDTILYKAINDIKDTQSLQNDLYKLEKWENEWQMKFNVDKCHLLIVTTKQDPHKSSYTLHGQKLEQVSKAKYLGVEINEKLAWKDHIQNIAKKGNRTSAFMYRNLKGCPQKVMTHCYKGIVRPILEYASPIWDPSFQNLQDELEFVQRRSARRIFGDFSPTSSVTEMLKKLELPTLKQRRKVDKVAMVYKIKHKLIDIPADSYLPAPSRPNPKRPNNFQIPNSKKSVHINSFFPSGIRLWNSLPPQAHSAPSLPSFKAALGEWAISF